MGRISDAEAAAPLSDGTPAAPLRFPLGMVSEPMRPYLELIRLEKPTGIKLVFWPFAWGLTMAAYRTRMPLAHYGMDALKSLAAAFILRASACTINDIFDRKVDAGVGMLAAHVVVQHQVHPLLERTRSRPLPSGRISVSAAAAYLFIQYSIGIIFYLLTLSGLALYVALFQLLPLFAIYPLLKRITYWPQAWLGLAMNFGFISAWVATTGYCDVEVLTIGTIGCWCWTMLYDTVYACQDIKDDLKTGVRSTAILFGSWIRPLLTTCGLGFAAAMAVVGHINGQSSIYFFISVGGTFLHLIWQYTTVDLEIPESCWGTF
ncbi:hypothetical protein MD484_g4199, partial [Candolleomyces efflorescens]